MKVMSLNVWGGRVFEPLKKFLVDYSKEVGVFCFQEMFNSTDKIRESHKIRTHLFDELSDLLQDFQGYFAPALKGFDIEGPVDFDLEFGLAIFVKKSVKVTDQGDIFVYGKRFQGNVIVDDYIAIPRNLEYVKFELGGEKVTVATLHGIWTPTKSDTESRIEQSKITKKFLDSCEGKKILCGDFNLSPNTESVAILEKSLKNLIKENNIPTTRSKLYTGKEKFADYMMVSPEVKIKDFKVLQDPVSDHLPLLLEFP